MWSWSLSCALTWIVSPSRISIHFSCGSFGRSGAGGRGTPPKLHQQFCHCGCRRADREGAFRRTGRYPHVQVTFQPHRRILNTSRKIRRPASRSNLFTQGTISVIENDLADNAYDAPDVGFVGGHFNLVLTPSQIDALGNIAAGEVEAVPRRHRWVRLDAWPANRQTRGGLPLTHSIM
jgi:hypothetical protein